MLETRRGISLNPQLLGKVLPQTAGEPTDADSQ